MVSETDDPLRILKERPAGQLVASPAVSETDDPLRILKGGILRRVEKRKRSFRDRRSVEDTESFCRNRCTFGKRQVSETDDPLRILKANAI